VLLYHFSLSAIPDARLLATPEDPTHEKITMTCQQMDKD
jgi:hypothetical protein